VLRVQLQARFFLDLAQGACRGAFADALLELPAKGGVKIPVGRFAAVQKQHPILGVEQVTEHGNSIWQHGAVGRHESPFILARNVEAATPQPGQSAPVQGVAVTVSRGETSLNLPRQARGWAGAGRPGRRPPLSNLRSWAGRGSWRWSCGSPA